MFICLIILCILLIRIVTHSVFFLLFLLSGGRSWTYGTFDYPQESFARGPVKKASPLLYGLWNYQKKKIEVEFDVWRSCVDKVPSSAAVSMEEGWREKGCINHLHSGLLSLFMKGWSVWKKPSKSRIYFFSFWKCFYIKLKSLKTRCMNMIDHTWSRKQQSFWYSIILIRNPIWMESRLRTE